MVSWMYNNAKDVKTEIDNTLCAFAPFSLNWKTTTQRRDDAKNKSLRVHFTGIFDCVPDLLNIVWMYAYTTT
uniref:Uncharacterized protein n=1 Tax=Candidatus Methanophaga sp. ANME-1 ERB7 TaxID=2759913 RepID=A0A7G9Z1Q7_9EURY|nr:hypothetical protein MOEJAMDC_00004 [Methanosarcinales archaeon ANME-1 ERB7]